MSSQLNSRQVTTVTLPIAEVVLRDGRRVRMRPIRPDDRERWLDFFGRQSLRSRYLRFQHAKQTVTDEEITHFTNVVPPDRAAYVAVSGSGEQERILAIGRWDSTGPDTAEIAFAVADDAQSRGLGTALLEQLAYAGAKLGFRYFDARVLPENRGMLDVFEGSGLMTDRYEDEGLVFCRLDLADLEDFERNRAVREHVARTAGVSHIMNPRTIAVVGASRNRGSVGNVILRNLLSSGFTGTVLPVNRSAGAVCGVLAYPQLRDIPVEVDLAVIAVPASEVMGVVEQCAERGVWGLVVISAGFSETGQEGAALEQRLREKVLDYGGRMVGPNCLGVINTAESVGMNATFAPGEAPRGNLSMGSQSGALGLALLDYARSIGMGISQFVSIGNRADISSNDLLEFWEDDSDTGVVLLYLESFGNPRKFSQIARRVSRKKPVIALKGGTSQVGARAASSHTASLAESAVVGNSLFQQSGVIRVESMQEMFDVARVLAYQPVPSGGRVGIITNAGGPGILAADTCQSLGLAVPELDGATKERLRAFLPSGASVTNPVDMIAAATPEQYERAVSELLRSDSLDTLLVIYVPPVVTKPEDVAAAVARAAENGHGKTVAACFMTYGEGRTAIETANGKIPSFEFPENAVRALARATDYGRFRAEPEGRTPRFPHIRRSEAEDVVKSAPPETWLYPEDALKLLDCYGIPVAQTRVAMSASEAAAAAEETGFPAAMKLRSRTVIHKTDVKGVRLGLRTKREVESAFNDIAAGMESAGMADAMEGVVIQPMRPGVQEVVLGMSRDPVFGPVIMVGLGGTTVELFRDVSFSLHPLTDADPDRMLRQLKSLALLQGWRGSAPGDLDALKDVMLRFSALVTGLPQLETIELNPLMVLPQGHGCVAVDARALTRLTVE